jgi:transcriptional regulator with XRE-family HTH domain
MTKEGIQRGLLREFLQAARARLRPEDIGIKPAPNRRGDGLHQADVADALIVSDRWYNGFENGTAGSVRQDLLDDLAAMLRLTAAERTCLYLLATSHEPAVATIEPPHQAAASRDVMIRLLSLLGPGLPALLCDIAWNVLACNPAMAKQIAGNKPGSPAPTNVISWLFTDQAERAFGNIEHARQTAIGQVHLALARLPCDPLLQDLLARLQQIPAARRLWDRQRISDEQVISPQQVRTADGQTRDAHIVSLELPGRLRLLTLVPTSICRAPSRTGD